MRTITSFTDTSHNMRAVLAGWFSFEKMGATAGDLMARDVVAAWLDSAGVPYDVVVAPPFTGGLAWDDVREDEYSHLIFVCGPFGNGTPITQMLERFSHCRLVGINLSMLDDLDRWNPFDLLLERDSSERVRPELVFAARKEPVPVIGLILVHRQKEYGQRAKHESIERIISEVLENREAAVVRIDTRLDENSTGLRTPREVESLIAKMDFVITTRLHGTVLALKNGVPAIAIDPIAGGAKISRQCEAIGWPAVLLPEDVNVASINRSLDFCLSDDARILARERSAKAVRCIAGLRNEFLRYIQQQST